MVGLIGPNGSGKTTLFDCLSRVLGIDAGAIAFDGSDITRLKPHQVARLGVSRTFQVIRVYRDLTVLENMELSIQWGDVGLRDLFRRTDEATRRKADELLEFLLLGPMRDEPAGNLSGGQHRLLEIGMALMSDPDRHAGSGCWMIGMALMSDPVLEIGMALMSDPVAGDRHGAHERSGASPGCEPDTWPATTSSAASTSTSARARSSA